MHRRLFAAVFVSVLAGTCAVLLLSSTPSAVAQSEPVVTVSPSTGLHDGQSVRVTVHGSPNSAYFISECASAQAANPAGCGPEPKRRTEVLTGRNGFGESAFTVHTLAASDPLTPAVHRCTDRCVVVASLEIRPSIGYARLRFGPAGHGTTRLPHTGRETARMSLLGLLLVEVGGLCLAAMPRLRPWATDAGRGLPIRLIRHSRQHRRATGGRGGRHH